MTIPLNPHDHRIVHALLAFLLRKGTEIVSLDITEAKQGVGLSNVQEMIRAINLAAARGFIERWNNLETEPIAVLEARVRNGALIGTRLTELGRAMLREHR